MVLLRSRGRSPSAVPATPIAAEAPLPELTAATVSAGEVARWAELHEATGVLETVSRVLECVLRVAGGECAGTILIHRGRLASVGATDSRVQQADRLQLEFREGPSMPLTSVHGGVLISDTEDDLRWPSWSPRVAEFGLRSVLTVPLATAESTVGSLTVYAEAPNHFTGSDVAGALLLARHAATAVADVQQIADMARAVEARHVIGQAQGLLMERFGIDADQAFAVLRRYSQDGNVKLRVVAARLVATRELSDGSAAGGLR